jgi:hypothetical protein
MAILSKPSTYVSRENVARSRPSARPALYCRMERFSASTLLFVSTGRLRDRAILQGEFCEYSELCGHSHTPCAGPDHVVSASARFVSSSVSPTPSPFIRAPVLHHLLWWRECAFRFARMRDLGFPLAGLRWVRRILRPEPADCSRLADRFARVFRRSIAAGRSSGTLWGNFGLSRAHSSPRAYILGMVPLYSRGARVPAVQAYGETPFCSLLMC